jgi:hypothetical protein
MKTQSDEGSSKTRLRDWLLRYSLPVVQSRLFTLPQLLAIGFGVLAMNLCFIVECLYTHATKIRATKRARAHARAVCKPVLNYGCMQTSCGDVNCDIVHRDVPNFELIAPSPARTPYPDKHFGAAICAHVQEHVPDPWALERELNRVADKVFKANPSPLLPGAWIYPEHLWVFIRGRPYRIRSRAPNLLAAEKGARVDFMTPPRETCRTTNTTQTPTEVCPKGNEPYTEK